MSVNEPSWEWAVDENSDQDWNNGWTNTNFQHNNTKLQNSSDSATRSALVGGNNNSGLQQDNQHHASALGHPTHPPPQQPNSTSDYFTSRHHIPLNNNSFPEVENKEVAPPDHHHSSNFKRGMKLGSKQGLGRGNIPRTVDSNSHANMNQYAPYPHQQDTNHHQPMESLLSTHQSTLRTQPHQYSSDSGKEFFQVDHSNPRSYFDQIDQRIEPQLHSQPLLIEPTTIQPPTSSSSQIGAPPQNEPRNITYFQTGYSQSENLQNINNMYSSNDKHTTENTSPNRGTPPQAEEKPTDVQEICSLPPISVKSHDQNEETLIINNYKTEPTSLKTESNVPRQFSQEPMEIQMYHEQNQHYSQTKIFDDHKKRRVPHHTSERNKPAGHHGASINTCPENKRDQFELPPPPLDQQFSRDQSLPHYSEGATPPQTNDHRFQPEKSIPPSQLERPLFHDSQSAQEFPMTNVSNVLPPSEVPTFRDSYPPQEKQLSREELPPQTERPLSRNSQQGRSVPEYYLPPTTTHLPDQESSRSHPSSENQSSQNNERSNPPETPVEKIHFSHERSPSMGSDRSGSLGKERSIAISKKKTHNYPENVEGRSLVHEEPLSKNIERPNRVPSRSPGAGEDRSSPPTRPDNLESLPPESHVSQQMSQLSIHHSDQLGDCPLDRNEYMETSQLSNQEAVPTEKKSRHSSSDTSRKNRRGERREVIGEAEPLTGRVVVGHTTPIATPPLTSDEIDGGGSGSMERMVVGERREQISRNNHRSSRRRNHHRRESSYDEDDPDYSSDNRRGHRDDYRRDERHRKRRDQDPRSSDYISDEDYEIDRRAYARRDRKGRDRDRDRDRDRERDYDPDYRRDYYRDDLRRPGRSSRDREYYRYNYEDYPYREHSRPSSRSESDYRRMNLDYQSRNQSHHYFNTSMAGVLGGREYEANPQYYEMLRKTNPMAYAIWYQDYMRKLQDTRTHSAFTHSDRASIHSGQSSGNRVHSATPSQVLDTNPESFEDYCPRLFATPHVRGNFDNQGRLLVVNACDPLDGQLASVQLLSIEPDDQDSTIKEFLDSPGPFIPGVTHRSSVLQYLRKMSDQAVQGSEKLLYDLVHLIVKSNGKPDATDISELLLESYRKSRGETRDQWDPDPSTFQPISHLEMITNFRNLLHQGNKQEALEWAMKHGGWGHALFLAGKMDLRTQNRVAAEFARSLSASDPLTTLYQMMSGGLPASATASSDRRWADWRPHLAMVLSNLTDNPSSDLLIFSTLADGLTSRGRLYAAHSCYIIAQVMFGNIYRWECPNLLGCSEVVTPVMHQTMIQHQQSVGNFSYKSFLLTQCYEYAIKQSQPMFFLPVLQRYKLLVAWRLVEWGRGRQALLYCEILANELLQSNNPSNADVIRLLLEVTISLKASDPSTAASSDITSAPDPDWLQQLKQIAATLPQEDFEPAMTPQTMLDHPNYSNFEPQPLVPMYPSANVDSGFMPPLRTEEAPTMSITEPSVIDPPTSTSTPSKGSDGQQVSPPVQQGNVAPMQTTHPVMQPVMQPLQQPSSLPPMPTPYSHPNNFSSQPSSYTDYVGSAEVVDHAGEGNKTNLWESERTLEPQSMASNEQRTSFFSESDNLLQDNKNAGKKNVQPVQSQKPNQTNNSDSQKNLEPNNANSGGGGWLGGFLGKLYKPKPGSKMCLPSDTDKKIVFDPATNKWIDKDKENSESAAAPLKPPPTGMPMSNFGPGSASSVQPTPGLPTPPSNSNNMFKLRKNKSMKNNYVDIMSSSGTASKINKTMEPIVGAPLGGDSVKPNYYVPRPDGSDNRGSFNPTMHSDNQGQMAVPTMYNPANFQS